MLEAKIYDPRGALVSTHDDRLGISSVWYHAALQFKLEGANLPPKLAVLASEIARWETCLNPREREVVFLGILAQQIAENRGDTCWPIGSDDIWASLLVHMQAVVPSFDTKATTASLQRLMTPKTLPVLLGKPNSGRPLIVHDGQLYSDLLWQYQSRSVQTLMTLARRQPTLAAAKAALADVIRIGGPKQLLNDEQKQAVFSAVTGALTLISGGPGTGKTSIVVAIYRLLRRLGVAPGDIALVAPTGRAGNRIDEALREGLTAINSRNPLDSTEGLRESGTIHRLLANLGTEGFRHHAGSPLSYRWIIVDECSMAELPVMAHLLTALDVSATSLVLLGDANQLPPVGVGAIFRDAVGFFQDTTRALAPGAASFVLEHNYRMSGTHAGGRRISKVASQILNGVVDGLVAATPALAGAREDVITPLGPTDDIHSLGVNLLEPGEPAAATLNKIVTSWFATKLKPVLLAGQRTWTMVQGTLTPADESEINKILDMLKQSRLLALHNHGQTGTDGLNRAAHDLALALSTEDEQDGWLPGEPVMNTANNAELQISNGDLGIIVQVVNGLDIQKRLVAAFPRPTGLLLVPTAHLGESLVHAYASTVHKAQGSEHRHVALILPTQDSRLASRELIYTAITRAKESVLIVGSEDLLKKALQRRNPRHTRLREALSASIAEYST